MYRLITEYRDRLGKNSKRQYDDAFNLNLVSASQLIIASIAINANRFNRIHTTNRWQRGHEFYNVKWRIQDFPDRGERQSLRKGKNLFFIKIFAEKSIKI